MTTITQRLADALRDLLRCSTMKTEWGGTALNCGQKRLTDAIEALAAYDALAASGGDNANALADIQRQRADAAERRVGELENPGQQDDYLDALFAVAPS